MKKMGGMVLMGLGLAVVLAAPGLAKTTGIDVDGRTYLFQGDAGVYKEDGKTFVIGEDSLRIQEPGKPDRVFPMENTGDVDTFIAEGYAETAREVTGANVVTVEDTEGPGPRFEKYRAFGLAYDAARDALYLNGQRVRSFEDDYSISTDVYATIDYEDDMGAIDVAAKRDQNGALVGLRVLGNAEREAFYAPYAAYGLAYDAKLDQFSYQGQIVRSFLDVKKSNGEALTSGRFEGEITNFFHDGGTIDVTMIRDYQKPDAQGNGTLSGVEIKAVK